MVHTCRLKCACYIVMRYINYLVYIPSSTEGNLSLSTIAIIGHELYNNYVC